MMPAFIRGVINLRGAVVPVIDLSVRFGRAPVEVTRRTCIVIIEIDNAGERQDDRRHRRQRLRGARHPGRHDRAAAFLRRAHPHRFHQGMGKVNDRFVIILNVDQVLSVDEMAQLSQAAQLSAPAAT
jgi:purine-binding chemotaxis protein CheW